MKARLFIFALAVTGLFTSCNEYYEDMDSLGKRVEVLEDSVLSIDNSLQFLELLTKTIETQGYITRIEDHEDGSCTIHMMGDFDNTGTLTERTITLASGRNGIKGLKGDDGKAIDQLLGVAKDDNGRAYWIFNGEPLVDEDGNIIYVNGPDGNKGEKGDKGDQGKSINGSNAKMPQVRVNEDTGMWEISTDGGKSWNSTGVVAKGDEGARGKKGETGDAAPIDLEIIEYDTYLIFIVHYSKTGLTETYKVPKEGM